MWEGEEQTCTQVGFNLRLYMDIILLWHVLRGPFYFPGSLSGEGEGSSFLPEDTLEGNSGAAVVVAIGLWVVLVLLMFPLFLM